MRSTCGKSIVTGNSIMISRHKILLEGSISHPFGHVVALFLSTPTFQVLDEDIKERTP